MPARGKAEAGVKGLSVCTDASAQDANWAALLVGTAAGGFCLSSQVVWSKTGSSLAAFCQDLVESFGEGHFVS